MDLRGSIPLLLLVLHNRRIRVLLFILYTTKIGPYVYLLAVFAVCDIFTSCAHSAFQPIVHMTYAGFYFFPRHGKIGNHNIMYEQLETPTLGISRRSDQHSVHFREIAPIEIEEIYGIDLRDSNRGFTVLAVRRPDIITGSLRWHWSSVIGISMLIGMFLCTASVILYCMWQTNNITKLVTSTNDCLMIPNTQIITAIPVIFSYAPLSVILLFPTVTGISLGAFGNVLFTLTSIFPSIDALFVLFFIKALRNATIRLLHLPIKIYDASIAEATTDFTTMIEVLPKSQVNTTTAIRDR
ncbi:hypothetical protein PRIPAC_80511 [Pristionchus pacificus]|uniref:G protein-coupled receptor n=1 Tax=Pristionchus pacificus TaxID=54126 RepID=A0A2A6CKQ8_PRIPA|nr:hypothetical protein PRIPAC_80511 [Pristionchus pacificus]|eukprot:PDM78678.1 G protein-coupled receptor [Pristionchus pacificus]